MITKVWIDETDEECVCCGACESICDAIFRVPEKCEIVGNDYAKWDSDIREAADCCPADVIRFAEDGQDVPINKEKIANEFSEALSQALAAERAMEIEQQKANIINMFELRENASSPLTFDSALSILYHGWPKSQLMAGPNPMDFYASSIDLSGQIVNYVRVMWKRATSNIVLERNFDRLRYKVLFTDPLSGKVMAAKWCSTKMSKLTIGQFTRFVQSQRELINV